MSLVGLLLLDLYLKLNVMAFDAVSPYLWLLALAVIIMGFTSLWMAYGARKVVLPEYAWVLSLFIAFYIFRLGVDYQSWGDLKAGTLATTGGVVLFYLLGCLVTYTVASLSIHSRWLPMAALVYVVVSLLFTVWATVSFLVDLREDIFLVAGVDGMYQRAGAFMVCSLLVGFAFMHALYARCLASRYIKAGALLLFIVHCLGIAVLAQMIGSNNATVSALGVALVAAMMLRDSKKQFLDSTRPRLTFSFFIKFVASRCWKVMALAILFLAHLLLLTSVDISNTRLLGFGAHESSSLSSRYELLANFPIHFSISPVLGDLESAALTTGEGSYVHSFAISILTHLGLIGFVLFLLFLFLAVGFLMSRDEVQVKSDGRGLRICKFLLFSGLFMIACVGNYFTVSVIWFLIGMLFPLVVITTRESYRVLVKEEVRI